ncbi:hypothetical protein NDN08_005594 [Rhodosorus marinus]|uniref:Uncharacterized protein n=1 Tax=Rhodosorus marinus TaxID=101924 RepID=A0AAV8V4Y5_9RHOD|nr:hypothetical protein NDN08_005594 [Rhodosorus marinus]
MCAAPNSEDELWEARLRLAKIAADVYYNNDNPRTTTQEHALLHRVYTEIYELAIRKLNNGRGNEALSDNVQRLYLELLCTYNKEYSFNPNGDEIEDAERDYQGLMLNENQRKAIHLLAVNLSFSADRFKHLENPFPPEGLPLGTYETIKLVILYPITRKGHWIDDHGVGARDMIPNRDKWKKVASYATSELKANVSGPDGIADSMLKSLQDENERHLPAPGRIQGLENLAQELLGTYKMEITKFSDEARSTLEKQITDFLILLTKLKEDQRMNEDGPKSVLEKVLPSFYGVSVDSKLKIQSVTTHNFGTSVGYPEALLAAKNDRGLVIYNDGEIYWTDNLLRPIKGKSTNEAEGQEKKKTWMQRLKESALRLLGQKTEIEIPTSEEQSAIHDPDFTIDGGTVKEQKGQLYMVVPCDWKRILVVVYVIASFVLSILAAALNWGERSNAFEKLLDFFALLAAMNILMWIPFKFYYGMSEMARYIFLGELLTTSWEVYEAWYAMHQGGNAYRALAAGTNFTTISQKNSAFVDRSRFGSINITSARGRDLRNILYVGSTTAINVRNKKVFNVTMTEETVYLSPSSAKTVIVCPEDVDDKIIASAFVGGTVDC